jgi:hypothetical protein
MLECSTCEDYDLFQCMDCGACTNCDGEYYMVHDEIWYSVITPMDQGDMLCIGCLEFRRGKLLTKDDFTAAPVNDLWGQVGSTRLKNRLRKVAASATV